MEKTLLLLSIFCLQSLTNAMQNNETKKPQDFKLTLDAENGSVKQKTKRHSLELKLSYDLLNQDPSGDSSYNIGAYTQLPQPSESHQETQISQEDI